MRITNPQNIFGQRLLDTTDLSNPFKTIKKTLIVPTEGSTGIVYCEITAEELGVPNFDGAQLTQAHVHTDAGLTLILPEITINSDKTVATITFFTHEDDWRNYLVKSSGNIYETFLSFYTRSEEGIAAREPQVMESPIYGYPVIETDTNELHIINGNWYKITSSEGSTITVFPQRWENRVATCFIDTSVVINIQGVQWLYGAPTLISGKRHIIAVQQIDADTILANLAVVI